VFPEIVVVVVIPLGFVQERLLIGDSHRAGYVELLVIGAVRALEVCILLGAPFVVLGQAATKARYQLAQVGHLQPRLAAELLSVVHSEEYPCLDVVASKP